MQLREGDVLARRYRLTERIGSGGMSVIWRAWDEALQRTVAVKVLDGPLGTDNLHRDLIRREARAAARIEHPHAINVYDYGETVTPRGRVAAYVVMQLLDGQSLADRLAAGPLPWPEAVAVTAAVAEVLAAAHRRGVVHRDVTPENVMLTTTPGDSARSDSLAPTTDGVRLLDFGIATEFGRLEETLTFGTPPYVAPERIAGAHATGATDVYALGVLLFESLTGSVPFGSTWSDLENDLEATRRPVPPLDVPGLPPSVAAICRRCLAVDPADRPTADEVHTALTKITERGHRRWWIPVAAAVVLLALVSLVLATNRETRRRSAAPAPAPIVTSIVVTPSVAPTQAPPPVESAVADELTSDQAVDAIDEILARRAKAGEIRPDVVLDVHNQLNNLLADPQDAQRRIAGLRQQLRERQRQDAISAAARDELDQALVRLGAALTR
jgi:eukaryotic-like serine/threonine-protein kinase